MLVRRHSKHGTAQALPTGREAVGCGSMWEAVSWKGHQNGGVKIWKGLLHDADTALADTALACPQVRRMDTDLTTGSSSPTPEVGTESYMGEKRVQEAGWRDGEKVGEEK